MAWNEPGGNNNDPWKGRGNKNDGPPDLDEFFKNLQNKLSGLFGGGGASSNNQGGGEGFGVLIVIFLVLVGLFYFGAGAASVNEAERAVVLRLGVYHETKGPGFRWNPPLIDTVLTENVTQVRQWAAKEQMLTEDLNIVDIELSVQYSISDVKSFVLNVRNPEQSLQQAANSALRHVVGSSVMDQVLTVGREQLSIDVQERLQNYLDSYETGIALETVNIENSSPPDEVQSAFDDVIRAREDEERYKNQAQAYENGVIPEARGQAQRMIEEAEAYKERVIARAEGEAKRFELLLGEYQKAPVVTRQRLYLDAVQDVMSNSSKVMIDVEGGNNMLYLPLDKIVNASSRVATGEMTQQELDQVVNQVIERIGSSSSRSSSRLRETR